VDAPSEGEVSPCLGFWFLNPSACQVWLHYIVYLAIYCLCFAFFLWNNIFSIPIFSLVVFRKFLLVLYGDDRKKSTLGGYFSFLVVSFIGYILLIKSLPYKVAVLYRVAVLFRVFRWKWP
jgi:hypothetical protein